MSIRSAQRSCFLALTVVSGALLSMTLWVDAAAASTGVRDACDGTTTNSVDDICTENLQQLTDGLAMYALIAAVIGICISASLWALGSKGQNPGQELTGKRGLIVCLAAAFCIGGLPPFMTRLQAMATELDTGNPTVPAASTAQDCATQPTADCGLTNGSGEQTIPPNAAR